MNVLAVDTGLATFGAVVFSVRCADAVSVLEHQCRHVAVFTSATKAKKWDVTMVEDVTRRARDLSKWFETLIVQWKPGLVIAEQMGVFGDRRRGIENLYVQILNSVAWGVVVAEVQRRLLPFRMVIATTCRKTVCGRADEVLAQTVAMRRYPSYVRMESGVMIPLRVHARDALCVYDWASITGILRKAMRCG